MGRITLRRPKALNALTLPMMRAIARALDQWAADPSVRFILVEGAGERGLCAGGDIRWFYERGRTNPTDAEHFWRNEYALNARIARYPKPYLVLMDGLVMGGGVGISAHGSVRVVTERTSLAMPEAAIGIIPDVGATWLFSRAPGETGTYLALTGARIGAADAIWMGFADLLVPSDRLSDLGDAAARMGHRPDGIAALRPMIRDHAVPPGPAPLAAAQPLIDSAFRFDTVEACLGALQGIGTDWARTTLHTLARHSPTSLKVTLAALRAARRLPSLEHCLDMEFRICCRMLGGHDFYEGIRAAVIDKDRTPRWVPGRLEEVGTDVVAGYLAPLGERELGLAGDQSRAHLGP
jgi:enoyl-CoA hydratase